MFGVRLPQRAAFLAVAALLVVAGRPAFAQETLALDPNSPMAPLPDLGIPWPDLNTKDAVEGDAPVSAAQTTEVGDDQRYAVTVVGLEGIGGAVESRFDALSVLKSGQSKRANVAQIDRRARDDAELLSTLLRSAGYYDADIDTSVAPAGDRLAVKLTVDPGPLYRFSEVQLAGLGTTDGKADGLRDAFGVKVDTPVDADTVVAGEAALREKLGREGFPFAKVAESEVVVDHETRVATLALTVDPGTERKFGAIRVAGKKPPFGPRHVQTIARFRPGQTYDQAMVDDLRRGLIATGLISSVILEPVAVGTDTVDISTTMEPAPKRTVAGEIGYGTGEGFRVEASWQHRNLIKPEGAVTFRGVAGTKEQLLGATLRMGNFQRRDVVLNGRAIVSHSNLAAYDANTIEVGANLERQTNIIWQKKWTYSFGFELIASNERDFVPTVGIAQRRTFLIGALPGTLAYDGSDDLLNPTRGFRLAGRVSPELSLQGGTFGYARVQLDGSYYQPFGKRLVLAGRVRVGGIAGASREDIAPSRLFYSGGGGSVRGYSYQQIGPRNVLDQPIGGRSLAEFSLEARIRPSQFGGNFGIVPFLDGGNIFPTAYPKLTGLRLGAGVGLRYYSNFGPIRIDVGTPLARRPGETPIAVYVSLGQAF
ncbi:autotransporter assembly complex family protein [Sphingomonas sp.]|uniref:autotransporter assembly complex protein TamA n=1 Tax=Sphingomonas sp. TaxID=28214 RepID=UPI0025EA07BF|nr:autotransporter assembly complex family protein [Sphingomonas sp.]